jgi:threonine dehydrogenase-like Zn-dependent dehydrogenase
MIPDLIALSDVMGTGWFAADAANVRRGGTVAVVRDGAVGLLGILSAKRMGAERIIAMSRHDKRQKLARDFAPSWRTCAGAALFAGPDRAHIEG